MLGDSELEARGRDEDDFLAPALQRQNHVEVLERVRRARVDEVADDGRARDEAVVFQEVGLVALGVVRTSV